MFWALGIQKLLGLSRCTSGNMQLAGATVGCTVEVVMRWHAATSRALRSVEDSKTWLLEQVRGGPLRNALEILDTLKDQEFLKAASFIIARSEIFSELSEHEVAFEDELASRAGDFALSLCKNRCRRTLYLTSSFPHRLVMMLGTPAEQQAVVEEFRAASEAFTVLQGVAGATDIGTLMLSRSPFRTLAVEQARLGFVELGWQPHPDVIKLMEAKFKTVMQSQAVEDMNNAMKNNRQSSLHGGRFRRPQTSLAVSVRSKVLSTMHRFKPLSVEVHVPPGTEPVTSEAFSFKGTCSIPASSVATYNQKSPILQPEGRERRHPCC
jgi:hypothetical protein